MFIDRLEQYMTRKKYYMLGYSSAAKKRYTKAQYKKEWRNFYDRPSTILAIQDSVDGHRDNIRIR